MRRAAAWVDAHGVLLWLVVVTVVFSVAFAVAFRQIRDGVDRNCRTTQTSWDSRRQTALVLTAPTDFPPTDDLERRDAEVAINENLAEQRAKLLAGLGKRPRC